MCNMIDALVEGALDETEWTAGNSMGLNEKEL